MALKFYDKDHIYELDGEIIPSVSEISRFASKEIYNSDINKYILDNAKERGTAVHKATEQLDTVGTCDIASEYMPYIQAYLSFRKDFNIKKYKYIEKAFAIKDNIYKYAGTLDRVYKVDEDFAKAVKKHCKIDITEYIGYPCIIDLKTSSQVKKPLAQIQLPAYANLYIYNSNIWYSDLPLFILHLKNNGKYKLIYFEDNPKLFEACYTLHTALATKKKKKIIKE